MRVLSPFALLVLVGATACSSGNFAVAPSDSSTPAADSAAVDAPAETSPADTAVLLAIAGGWSGSVKNDATTCPGGFDIGAVTAIRAVITQSGVDISIKLEGLAGFGFQQLFGLDTLTGTIFSDKVLAKVVGTKEHGADGGGTCKNKWKAVLEGTVKGTAMTGTVTYTPVPVSGECTASFNMCSRTQSFTMNKEPGG